MHEYGERARNRRRRDQVPMVRHEAVRIDRDARLMKQHRFFQYFFEGLIVGRGAKDPSALRCAVQHVVDVPAYLIAASTRHAVLPAIAVPVASRVFSASYSASPDPSVLCR